MSTHIVELTDVKIELNGNRSTITINLPDDYESNPIDDNERANLERLHVHDSKWIEAQLDNILKNHDGVLADKAHPMRSPGAGICPRILLKSGGIDVEHVILHIRGTNRGQVWPLSKNIAHVFCWKEFAGVTGSAAELTNPRKTAIMELYEELALILSTGEILIPSGVETLYPNAHEQLRVARDRLDAHYGFDVQFSKVNYSEAVTEADLIGDPYTIVRIIDPTNSSEPTEFQAIVNYDPFTNALELSFWVNLSLPEGVSLTGIMSLSGPENERLNWRPYMEDIIVIQTENLKSSEVGKEVEAIHLLSVHGPENFAVAKPNQLFYSPSPTLTPIVSFLRGDYSFRSVLEAAYNKVKLM